MGVDHDLSQLTPETFEHLVNALALRVLGAGHTGFGPGPDGGRDGYFEGQAPYPSTMDRWSGRWYIQCKFHFAESSKDPEAWLRDQIKGEIAAFAKINSRRIWPDNWIIATNVTVSGRPETGTWDRAVAMVSAARPELSQRFHIWNGSKIRAFLDQYPDVAQRYGHFVTPGHVLAALQEQLHDDRAALGHIMRALLVRGLDKQRRTKLEHAGAHDDARPGVHQLVVDVPFYAHKYALHGRVLAYLTRNAAGSRRVDPCTSAKEWKHWRQHPCRGRVWFLHGGPGRGKSTLTQYFCQVQRAALLLQDEILIAPDVHELATSIRKHAHAVGLWPDVPRIPIYIELKEYAQWLGERGAAEACGVTTFLAQHLSKQTERSVQPGTLARALAQQSWVVVFDGLDEVPQDTRATVAHEVRHFVDDVAVEADLLTLCTSRPQGYADEFAALDGPQITLTDLAATDSLACAARLLRCSCAPDEADEHLTVLQRAIEHRAVAGLMATPLQAHIIAVIVRDGGEPPERRWELFARFYEITYRREVAKRLPDTDLSRVLREHSALIRAVHAHLGFVLHTRAETSQGAIARLDLDEFRGLIKHEVAKKLAHDIDTTADAVMRAAKERLVLINTPDDGAHVRFDIRQLQEFFAGEFLYTSFVDEDRHVDELHERLMYVAGDAHWREVMHFVLSGLIVCDHRIELREAIDVLRGLDGHDRDGGERVLARRIGTGAKLVAELLRDGMLENNRKLRDRFAPCLDAMAMSLRGMIDIRSMRAESRRWLLEHMYRKVIEIDFTESVGAGAITMVGLDDGDSRVERFLARLRHAPTAYLEVLISYARPEMHDDYVAPLWWQWIAVEFLRRSDWHEHRFAISDACDLLRDADTQVQPLDNSLSAYRALASLGVYNPLKSDDEAPPELRSVVQDTWWGWIDKYEVAVPSEYAWYRDVAQRASALAEPSGFFGLAAAVLRFVVNGTLSSYQKICQEIGTGDWDVLDVLSRKLIAHIPVPKDQCAPPQFLTTLNTTTEAAFSQALAEDASISGYAIKRAGALASLRMEIDETQFLAFLEVQPGEIIRSWLDQLEKIEYASIFWPLGLASRDSICRALAPYLVENPGQLWYRPQLWGRVFQLMGERESSLRRSLCEYSRNARFSPHDGEALFAPVEVHLPDEAPLLPPITQHLAAVVAGSPPMKATGVLERRHKTICAAATRCAPLDVLVAIANDIAWEPTVRASAIIIATLHEHGGLQFLREQSRFLVDSCTLSATQWRLATYVTRIIYLFCAQNESWAKALVGDLLDASRGDFEQIRKLEGILRRRQRPSQQPATRIQAEQRWLHHGVGDSAQT